MDILSVIFAVILTAVSAGVTSLADDQQGPTFGACQPGRDSCSQCYLALKQSLLGRDDNIQQLSRAFYPWNASNPVFVTVTYNFENSNKSKVWYWTVDSSFLFFQITTFQYLSLFYSKPAGFFSQKVHLTLDENCTEASEDMFKLLTQRLKNLIEKKDFNPEIDDNYFARSEENTEDILPYDTATYIFIFYIIAFALVVVITVLILLVFHMTKQWHVRLHEIGSERGHTYRYKQSKIFSISLSLGLLHLYALGLDIAAVITLKADTPVLKSRTIDENVLPIIVLGIDAFFAIYCVVCWTISCCFCVCDCLQNKVYFLFAISTLGPVFCLVIHLPYVSIAYLNDAAYATSIFIYYIVVFFALFGALDLAYGAYQLAAIEKEGLARQNEGKEKLQDETEERDIEKKEDEKSLLRKKKQEKPECFPCCPSDGWKLKCAFAVLIIALTTLLVLLIGMVTAALVKIPISKAFSDAPNRLFSFYQSAIVIVGAYIAYRSIFKKQPTLENAIKERKIHVRGQGKDDGENIEWLRLSKDEKVAAFYDYVIDLVVNFSSGKIAAKGDSMHKCSERESVLPKKEDKQSGTLSVTVDVESKS